MVRGARVKIRLRDAKAKKEQESIKENDEEESQIGEKGSTLDGKQQKLKRRIGMMGNVKPMTKDVTSNSVAKERETWCEWRVKEHPATV